jgi:putative salt-induced outer membrane protein YdiY
VRVLLNLLIIRLAAFGGTFKFFFRQEVLMRGFSIAGVMTFVSFCLLCKLAHADTIQLTNGDRLTGEIVNKDRSTITLKTAYAGEVKITWSNVAQIQTDHPVSILMPNDTVLRGTIVPSTVGEVLIQSDELGKSEIVEMDQLDYINPAPEISRNVRITTGVANVGITATNGNNNTKNIHIDSEVVTRTKDNRFTIGAVANRATDGGVPSISNNRGYFKYDHFLDSKRYVYSNLSGENDRFKDLRLRTSAGLGRGYQIYESPDLNLSVEGGLNYVKEDYWLKQDKQFPSMRWSMKYNQLFFEKLTAFHEQEVIISLANAQDMLARTKTGLRFPLSRQLVGTLQYNIDWDRTPAPDTVSMDRTLMFNLGYIWQ